MTKRYEIAKYLTSEQRRWALAHTYRPTRTAYGPCPRDEEGYCPLGRATGISLAPGPGLVSEALETQQQAHGVPTNTVIRIAREFIVDWDEGILLPSELAEALAVTS